MGCRLACLPRGLAVGVLAAGLVLGGGKLAMAGFFDACLAPGDQTIQVHQDTVVRERVLLPSTDFDDCIVEVDPGVTLTLDGARIDVVGDEWLGFEGAPTAKLVIRNSRIRACDTDIFGFSSLTISNSAILDPNTICDVKEFQVGGDIVISGSVLTTEEGDFPDADSDIQIISEVDGGKVSIVGSTLRAADDLEIEGPAGVTLTSNRLIAASTFTATSAARLEATGNVVSAPDGVTLTGNPCILAGNSPSLSCTAPPPPP
jgi:hypothetical protein